MEILCADVLNEICFWLDDARNFLVTCKHVHDSAVHYRAECSRVVTLFARPQLDIAWLRAYTWKLYAGYRIHKLALLRRFLSGPVLRGNPDNFFVLYALITAKHAARRPRFAPRALVLKFPVHSLGLVFVTSSRNRFAVLCFARPMRQAMSVRKKLHEYVFLMDHYGTAYTTRRLKALPHEVQYFLQCMVFDSAVAQIAEAHPGYCVMCAKAMQHTPRATINPGLGSTCFIRYMSAHRQAVFDYRVNVRTPVFDEKLLTQYNTP
jgi:hypothetical protein